jgi:predicted alpha/beta hydrolase
MESIERSGDRTRSAAHSEEPAAVTITAADGRKLAGLLVSAASPRAALLINGAAGFPREFYLRFAKYAASRGYHALVYDYRGMGTSRLDPLARDPARMSDWGAYDIPAAFAWLEERFAPLPLVTLGHSIGGQFTGMLSDPMRAAAHVMVGASVGYWRWEHAPFRYMALFFWRVYGPLMLGLRGYVPKGVVWSGLSLPRGVFEQWREWCMRTSHFAPDFPGALRGQRFADVRRPVLSLNFEDDPIATRLTVPPLLDLYPNAPKEVRWIAPSSAGVRHIGHHGFFHERHRDSLWRDVMDWIESAAMLSR